MLLIVKRRGCHTIVLPGVVVRRTSATHVVYTRHTRRGRRTRGLSVEYLERRAEFVGVVHGEGRLDVLLGPPDFESESRRVPLA